MDWPSGYNMDRRARYFRVTPMVVYWIALFLAFVPLTSAWSFNISSRVVQCANLSVTWDGGVAPWELVLIPVGALQGPEIRTIVDANITSGNTYSFQLKFPTGSSFLAMMSDATGVGTGGTSDLITVLDGSSSCLATSATSPLFYLYLNPEANPTQCQTEQVGWQSANSQGQVRITAMIPGGESFALPVPATGGASSFNWTVDLRAGTEFLYVAGDERGFGTGGSSQLYTVQSGSSGCINGASPSSTAAPAAGGIYATGSGGGSVTGIPGQPAQSQSSGGSSSSSSNVGAIIGGVIGGVTAVAILLLLLLFFYRRRRLRREVAAKRDDADLLTGEPRNSAATGAAAATGTPIGTAGTRHSQGMSEFGGRTSLSSATGTAATSGAARTATLDRAPSIPPLNFGRPSSDFTGDGGGTVLSSSRAPDGTERTSSGAPPSAFFNNSQGDRPTTPTTTSARRGGKGPLPIMRPVNVIVHDDAGQVPPPSGSGSPTAAEVVELPPSYADVRRKSEAGGA